MESLISQQDDLKSFVGSAEKIPKSIHRHIRQELLELQETEHSYLNKYSNFNMIFFHIKFSFLIVAIVVSYCVDLVNFANFNLFAILGEQLEKSVKIVFTMNFAMNEWIK